MRAVLPVVPVRGGEVLMNRGTSFNGPERFFDDATLAVLREDPTTKVLVIGG